VGKDEITSVFITGANAGIGRELARQLGTREEISRVLLGCRDRERGVAALEALTGETGRDVFELCSSTSPTCSRFDVRLPPCTTPSTLW
jgi:NAD(P)-dependent dehydrogenase (short-subunit alcohol dehydrogenase family)